MQSGLNRVARFFDSRTDDKQNSHRKGGCFVCNGGGGGPLSASRFARPCFERSVIAPALLYLLQSLRASCPPVTLAHPCASSMESCSRRASRQLAPGVVYLIRPCIRTSSSHYGLPALSWHSHFPVHRPWSRSAAFVPKGISFGHTPCTSAFGTIQEKKAFMWLRCGGFFIWKLTYAISVFVSFSYVQKLHDGFCKYLWILCLLRARMNDHLLYWGT